MLGSGSNRMRDILTVVAVSAAAIALSAPGWAQGISPGGNAGPGLTPYTTGPAQPPRPYTAPPPGTVVPPPPSPSATNQRPSAAPQSYPTERQARAYRGRAGSRPSRGYSTADNSANQLNQEELSKLQATNYSNPAPPGYYPAPPPGYASPPGYPPAPPPGYPMGAPVWGAPYRPY